LLRACGKWPSHRTSEQRDKLASPNAEHGRWLASSCVRPKHSTRRGCQIGCCTAESRAPSAEGFMAEMGHKPAYPIAAEPELMSVVIEIATDWDGKLIP
jgi:hypothetical protein